MQTLSSGYKRSLVSVPEPLSRVQDRFVGRFAFLLHHLQGVEHLLHQQNNLRPQVLLPERLPKPQQPLIHRHDHLEGHHGQNNELEFAGTTNDQNATNPLRSRDLVFVGHSLLQSDLEY